MSLLLKLF